MSAQGRIYRRIPSVDPALLSEAAPFGMADLHEALGAVDGRACLMGARMRPIAPGQRAIGQAVTSFNFPGDNLMIHKALQLAEAGQILVLVNGGGEHGALWGDVAGTFARQKGIAGIVVDGPVRDVAALIELGVPVWSTSISASHPEKRGPGSVNVPVVCAGVRVEPGDVIVADSDGVLVVPRAQLGEAVAGARARSGKEAAIRKRLLAGESLYGILGMQALVDASGAREHDGTWQDDPAGV